MSRPYYPYRNHQRGPPVEDLRLKLNRLREERDVDNPAPPDPTYNFLRDPSREENSGRGSRVYHRRPIQNEPWDQEWRQGKPFNIKVELETGTGERVYSMENCETFNYRGGDRGRHQRGRGYFRRGRGYRGARRGNHSDAEKPDDNQLRMNHIKQPHKFDGRGFHRGQSWRGNHGDGNLNFIQSNKQYIDDQSKIYNYQDESNLESAGKQHYTKYNAEHHFDEQKQNKKVYRGVLQRKRASNEFGRNLDSADEHRKHQPNRNEIENSVGSADEYRGNQTTGNEREHHSDSADNYNIDTHVQLKIKPTRCVENNLDGNEAQFKQKKTRHKQYQKKQVQGDETGEHKMVHVNNSRGRYKANVGRKAQNFSKDPQNSSRETQNFDGDTQNDPQDSSKDPQNSDKDSKKKLSKFRKANVSGEPNTKLDQKKLETTEFETKSVDVEHIKTKELETENVNDKQIQTKEHESENINDAPIKTKDFEILNDAGITTKEFETTIVSDGQLITEIDNNEQLKTKNVNEHNLGSIDQQSDQQNLKQPETSSGGNNPQTEKLQIVCENGNIETVENHPVNYPCDNYDEYEGGYYDDEGVYQEGDGEYYYGDDEYGDGYYEDEEAVENLNIQEGGDGKSLVDNKIENAKAGEAQTGGTE